MSVYKHNFKLREWQLSILTGKTGHLLREPFQTAHPQLMCKLPLSFFIIVNTNTQPSFSYWCDIQSSILSSFIYFSCWLHLCVCPWTLCARAGFGWAPQRQIKLELDQTHLEHVFKGVEVSKEFLHWDFPRVKDKVLSQVGVLLLHILVQQIQLLMLLMGRTHKNVETRC